MNKEIHFYAYSSGKVNCSSYYETKQAIERQVPDIRTNQMSFLSTMRFEEGYRIFVHETPLEDMYEIVLGTDNTNTRRDIRLGHDLFKLWKAGEFRD